jgi:hypothetical protein
LWTIAKTLSCHSYRDMMETNPTEVIMVAYGTANDLFSLQTLFQAAEMLALRTMPAGDRRFRTSWWIGYCEGIARKLEQENRVIVKEAPGVGSQFSAGRNGVGAQRQIGAGRRDK